MPQIDKLSWLVNKFYVFFDASPTSDAVVSIYEIDKLGNPVSSSVRKYRASTIAEAIRIAYNKESTK